MSEPTKTSKTESSTSNGKEPKKKRTATVKVANLQLQRIVGLETEILGVFRTQKEGIEWLTENRVNDIESAKHIQINVEGAWYQFARLLGKPKSLNVETKVKLK